MASTIAIYTGDGTKTDFTVPFDYLAKKFVKVTVGLTPLTGGDYGDTSKDYYFLDKTTVRLKTPPTSGTEVTIRRFTSATDRVVSFKDASILKATDLDTASVQTIHIAEEGRDVINDALIADREGNWDAKGKRIVNLGNPVGDNDAVTYGVYKADSKGAYQARIEAEKARDRAVEAETNSKNSELNAKKSEDAAKVSEDAAKVSEDAAKVSEGIAVNASKHADTVKAENQAIITEARGIQTNVQKLDKSTKENATIANTKAEEAKVSAEKAKDSELKAKASEDVVTGIAGTIMPIAPEIKIVADNITHVVTDSSNIDKISIVSSDLEGTLKDVVFDDYGDLGSASNPSITIVGGSIKTVSDNIESVRTVAGLAPDFNKVINSVDTVTKLTVRAEGAANKAESSEIKASESSTLAKDWAVKFGATPVEPNGDFSAKMWATYNGIVRDGRGSALYYAEQSQRSANLATTKANEAHDDADRASQSATQSDASARNASASAGTATAQATIATTKAGEAKTSADNAALSKDAAKTSEIEAKRQADLAKGYAEQAGAGQLQSDWNQTDTLAKDFIKNKPKILSPNVEEIINQWWRFENGLQTTNVIQCLKEPFADNHLTTMKWVKGYVDPKISNLESKKANTEWVRAQLNNKVDTSVLDGFIDYGDLGNQ